MTDLLFYLLIAVALFGKVFFFFGLALCAAIFGDNSDL
jgi:hypothetical protein